MSSEVKTIFRFVRSHMNIGWLQTSCSTVNITTRIIFNEWQSVSFFIFLIFSFDDCLLSGVRVATVFKDPSITPGKDSFHQTQSKARTLQSQHTQQLTDHSVAIIPALSLIQISLYAIVLLKSNINCKEFFSICDLKINCGFSLPTGHLNLRYWLHERQRHQDHHR